MLKFIYGLPACGKTTTILNLVKEHINQNKSVVLIVPEQFSFQTERSVLDLLGDFDARKVEILTFTRLYDQICEKIGGSAGKLLGDGDKIILMNNVLNSLESQLLIWGKYIHSLNFSKTILDTIGEFKINSVSSDDIRKIADESDSIILKNKLLDLALIYDHFDALLGEKYIDPVDKLTKVYRDLEKEHYFENKTVFFDSFKAFTGQQFNIMRRIFEQAENVYVAINNDVNNKKQFDVFSNLRKNIDRIENIATKHSIDKSTFLDKPYYTNPKLASLERLMAGVNVNDDLEDTITICKCDSPFDEAEFAARNIRKIIRESNGKYRFKDFVIIARDTEKYQQAVERACKKNEIACFFDKRVGLNSLPFSFAVDAAIKALDFSTENILRFHKCGFSELTYKQISKLENYTYMWNIDGKIWENEWTMDSRGFTNKEYDLEVEAKKIKEINNLRTKAIKPILEFKKSFHSNAPQMATAIVNLLESVDAKSKLISLCNQFSNDWNGITPDALKQGYDRFMSVLNSIVICFGEKSISKNEFHEALKLALSIETVGVIPQFLDEVSFGSADRIQPARPKFAFILGANHGVFPKPVSTGGLLTPHDRKQINKKEIIISDNSVSDSIDEEYLVYSNVTCASEKIFISYSSANLKGEKLLPSPFVKTIIANLKPTETMEPLENLNEENLPETASAAFSEYCRRFKSKKDAATLLKAFENDDKFKNLEKTLNVEINNITPDNAKALYTTDLNLSASKFDVVRKCKFSYFCQYGLNAKKLQKAEFDVLQRGLIAHYALECIIKNHKTVLKTLTDDELCNLSDKYVEEYLSQIKGFDQVRDARSDFIITKIKREVTAVICHIVADFKQSQFEPYACEFKIGMGDGIDLNFDYKDGKIKINGSIDRIDKWGEYIRIVDYKTGSKTFKLPDILHGLNMQMLIYLYAITRGQGKPDENAAAIFYMPVKRDVNDDGLTMKGIIKGVPEIHEAMEKENKGEFVPKIGLTKENKINGNYTSFIKPDGFKEIFDHIERIMKETGDFIIDGDISVNPLDGRETPACKYCNFKNICNIENRTINKVESMKNDQVFKILEGEA